MAGVLGFEPSATPGNLRNTAVWYNSRMNIRQAIRNDLQKIIQLIADDPLGSTRESYEEPLPQEYETAFNQITADANNELLVAEEKGKVIGTLQLTFIPYLTYKGSSRAQIEAVRVDKAFRGRGVGNKLLEWTIRRAKEKGCHMVQLTTNKVRKDALPFYEKLGFKATHEGMKLLLK
jgi:GNAT superfamily N-acetyltransferase